MDWVLELVIPIEYQLGREFPKLKSLRAKARPSYFCAWSMRGSIRAVVGVFNCFLNITYSDKDTPLLDYLLNPLEHHVWRGWIRCTSMTGRAFAGPKGQKFRVSQMMNLSRPFESLNKFQA
jgi:hypothetical protein